MRPFTHVKHWSYFRGWLVFDAPVCSISGVTHRETDTLPPVVALNGKGRRLCSDHAVRGGARSVLKGIAVDQVVFCDLKHRSQGT